MALRLANVDYQADPERLDRWLSNCLLCGDRLELIEDSDETVGLRCARGCDPFTIKVALDAHLPRGDGAHAAPLASISRERVEWLWPARIPLGMLTLLMGDPGLGKSLLTLMLAAEVTREGGDVMVSSAEDHAGATIRPRAEAAGADLDRVHAITMRRDGAEDGLALPDDALELEELVVQTGARLVVIDPLMAHLPESVNSWRDQSVRRALAPLHRIAAAHGCAILPIVHLNKTRGGDALYRAGGSIGIPAAVRSALLLARDPSDGERGSCRVLAHVKCNVAPQAESLACEIEPIVLDGDERIETARIRVTGTSDASAHELLETTTGEERTERDEAVDHLRAELAEGPRPAKEVRKAIRDSGISDRTIDRAKAAVRVESHREGFGPGSHVLWSLPDAPGIDRQSHISPVASYEGYGSGKPNTAHPERIERHESDMALNGGNPNVAEWERLQEMSR
jgi:hypothetical protein